MEKLVKYVEKHTQRGRCLCGKCIDSIESSLPLSGHTVSTSFFEVSLIGEPDLEELQDLVANHKGEYTQLNPLDGKEHSYIELGGWIGDQGMALVLMAMGDLLGLWTLMTPEKVLPGIPIELQRQMAGSGLVTIIAPKERRSE